MGRKKSASIKYRGADTGIYIRAYGFISTHVTFRDLKLYILRWIYSECSASRGVPTEKTLRCFIEGTPGLDIHRCCVVRPTIKLKIQGIYSCFASQRRLVNATQPFQARSTDI